MSPSQLRHLPHLTITFCPLAFLSSSEPHFLFPHLFKISIMCFVEHFSVFYRALLFFSHFFPKIILCIYFLSCGFLSLPCTFHNRSFLSVLEIQPLSCQSLRVVVGSGWSNKQTTEKLIVHCKLRLKNITWRVALRPHPRPRQTGGPPRQGCCYTLYITEVPWDGDLFKKTFVTVLLYGFL